MQICEKKIKSGPCFAGISLFCFKKGEGEEGNGERAFFEKKCPLPTPLTQRSVWGKVDRRVALASNGNRFPGACCFATRLIPLRGTGFSLPTRRRQKKERQPTVAALFLVPVVGVEPTRYRYHRILSPARLPIPSHRLLCHEAKMLASARLTALL